MTNCKIMDDVNVQNQRNGRKLLWWRSIIACTTWYSWRQTWPQYCTFRWKNQLLSVVLHETKVIYNQIVCYWVDNFPGAGVLPLVLDWQIVCRWSCWLTVAVSPKAMSGFLSSEVSSCVDCFTLLQAQKMQGINKQMPWSHEQRNAFNITTKREKKK